MFYNKNILIEEIEEMKENKYDNPEFFEKYKEMPRSKAGLQGAGEWYIFRNMLPDLKDKRVLDLGCGFGWHCKYAREGGSKSVIGIDISEKMLEEAQNSNSDPGITYKRMAIEDIDFPDNSFDVVFSSLAFHYVADFNSLCQKVYNCLKNNGYFIFSVEHPVFTAEGRQDWIYDEKGERAYWPVDSYFSEGIRTADFLSEEVVKYHKTLTTYINTLLKNGFSLKELVEPEPDPILLEKYPGFKDELRRPIFLLISAQKN